MRPSDSAASYSFVLAERRRSQLPHPDPALHLRDGPGRGLQHPAHDVGHTGGTITSAGVILAGTFAVLALAGNSDQSRQLGFTIAFAILVDAFFVRTLLLPSVAVLLGRWNWWPSKLSVKLERL
jgi:uncharacterized membrane protein YdfJ with MMPL/SSD domain